jgi:Flp pilus assembly protein TadG
VPHGRQRGAFAVEFGLVLGLLLLLALAIANLGLAAWNYTTIAHASREGARYGSAAEQQRRTLQPRAGAR